MHICIWNISLYHAHLYIMHISIYSICSYDYVIISRSDSHLNNMHICMPYIFGYVHTKHILIPSTSQYNAHLDAMHICIWRTSAYHTHVDMTHISIWCTCRYDAHLDIIHICPWAHISCRWYEFALEILGIRRRDRSNLWKFARAREHISDCIIWMPHHIYAAVMRPARSHKSDSSVMSLDCHYGMLLESPRIARIARKGKEDTTDNRTRKANQANARPLKNKSIYHTYVWT